MSRFSDKTDIVENIGELILEALLSSNIESITHLILYSNKFWFIQERSSNVDLLIELISKQTSLQELDL